MNSFGPTREDHLEARNFLKQLLEAQRHVEDELGFGDPLSLGARIVTRRVRRR